jgi:lipoate-protein ligase A
VPRFRIWTYQSPAVVLGNAQRSLRNSIEQRANGRVELLQRQAGGGVVLTGPWMVSTSIILPYGHPLLCDSLVACYRWLGQLHAAALTEFGVPAYALPAQALPAANAMIDVRTVSWACFGGLSPWEVVDAGYRKLVGLAQRRRHAGVLLVAGTLIGATDWRLLCEVMGYPEDEAILRRRTVSAGELAGSLIEPERFASVLTRLIDSSLAR